MLLTQEQENNVESLLRKPNVTRLLCIYYELRMIETLSKVSSLSGRVPYQLGKEMANLSERQIGIIQPYIPLCREGIHTQLGIDHNYLETGSIPYEIFIHYIQALFYLAPRNGEVLSLFRHYGGIELDYKVTLGFIKAGFFQQEFLDALSDALSYKVECSRD